MCGGEALNGRFAPGSQPQLHPPPVGSRRRTSKETASGEPIHEAHGTVRTQLQAIGEFPHRYIVAAGETLDGQQRLVLLRRDPGDAGNLLAETEKAAQRLAQRGQQHVV